MPKNQLIVPHQNFSFERNIKLVPDSVARKIAINFNPNIFFNTANPHNHSNFKSKLNGHNQLIAEYTIKDHSGTPALYIFDFIKNEGYLFVSADYQIKPVLAFIEKGDFKKGDAPGGAGMWLNKTIQNTEIVRKGLYDNTNLAQAAWSTYYTRNQGKSSNYSRSNSQPDTSASPDVTAPPPPIDNPCQSDPDYSNTTTYTTGPLLPVEWAQVETFNDLCPYGGCSTTRNGHAPTGCVATAMAQVIRYWESPVGEYNYASMPANSGNSDVQQLMIDAGTSVGMIYGCAGSHPPSESWAIGGLLLNESTAERIADGFKSSYFGYSFADYDKSYDGYDYHKIETDIMYERPAILSGYPGKNNTWNYPEGDGHTWVCGGTSSTTFEFCMNGTFEEYSTLDFYMNWGVAGIF